MPAILLALTLSVPTSLAQHARPGEGVLPSDRTTLWNPGLASVGGIPFRDKVCATVSPTGTPSDAQRIQSAIDRCPAGQVVALTEGTFIINAGAYILLNKGITVRGQGPGRTILSKTDGAQPFVEAVGKKPSPLIVVGPAIFSATPDSSGVAGSVALTADAEKSSRTIEVADARNFTAGQIVLLDEASGAAWQPDGQGRGRIWAAPDWRVVWKKHDPPVKYVDDFGPDSFPTTPGTAGQWFSRLDRPTAEVKQIEKVSGSSITFTTPVHISYRKANAAQLSWYGRRHVTGAGVESLTLTGGDAGNLRFQWAALSWAKDIESTVWHGEGVAFNSAFAVELREFYIHDGAWSQPGGGGYAISLAAGSAELLIENGIAVRANKVMVSRSAGAGSVVGYNYMDMSYINTQPKWIETGINASHMVGSHHVLFEGNYAHNADSDNTHGNSIYLTFFRNHLRGIRAPFVNQAGGVIDDASITDSGPRRCVGLMAYAYWMSFIGNVLGAEGKMRGWVYEGRFGGRAPSIWLLGWDDVKPYHVDARVAATALRHGNFDYVTNSVRWDSSIKEQNLPPSLYLKGKPPFFDAGRGYTWPWVDPTGSTRVHTLPAKARFDAGTPFVQP